MSASNNQPYYNSLWRTFAIVAPSYSGPIRQWRVRMSTEHTMPAVCIVCVLSGPPRMATAYRTACSSSAAVAILGVFELLHSCTFRVNPHFDLEPDYIIRKPIVPEFNDVICVGKYCQLFIHESIIDQYAISALYSPPNCPFPFDDHHQNLIHPLLDRPLSPSQTASGSNQPFRHSSLLCTDRLTDRWSRRMFCTIHERSARYADRERRANNVSTLHRF